jgi:hypothetical protein
MLETVENRGYQMTGMALFAFKSIKHEKTSRMKTLMATNEKALFCQVLEKNQETLLTIYTTANVKFTALLSRQRKIDSNIRKKVRNTL